MILEHELKLHETSFDNPGLFSNFTYVKMKGPNKQLSNQSNQMAKYKQRTILFLIKKLVQKSVIILNYTAYSKDLSYK